MTCNQEDTSLIGRFFSFYCEEIKQAYISRNIERLAELREDWHILHDYIWFKIPVNCMEV